jgi:hypothetical protein
VYSQHTKLFLQAALEAFADGLRRELGPWNIPVSVIVPGLTHSSIHDKVQDDLNNVYINLPPEGVFFLCLFLDFHASLSKKKSVCVGNFLQVRSSMESRFILRRLGFLKVQKSLWPQRRLCRTALLLQ